MPDDTDSHRWIVLDTGALIAGTDALYALGGLTEGLTGDTVPSLARDERARFYVTPDVATETRDPRARARLEALDRIGCVVQRAPSAEAVAAVAQAAKNSGDYPVLSAVDLRVLALTWMLEVERNGDRYLKQVPKATVLGEIRHGRGVTFEDVDRWEREEMERKDREDDDGDGWTTVEKKKMEVVKQTKKRKKKKKKKKSAGDAVGDRGDVSHGSIATREIPDSAHSQDVAPDDEAGNDHSQNAEFEEQPSVSEQPASVTSVESLTGAFHSKLSTECNVESGNNAPADLSNGLLDASYAEEVSDDDGTGWINEDNLEEHLARDGGEEEVTAEDRMRVACVTTDFAMQNTMLQMGLKLLSVDGRRTIRQIRRFALRCQSCSTVTRELQRKFCEKCGNATLHRVAFKVDKKGIARVFLNPKKKPILRGTKYPIPLPRGGRHNKDLILCEDQIDPVKQRRLEKQREKQNVDVLDPCSFYNAGLKFNPHDRPLIVGYGKRNPNQVRPTGKGKK